MWALHHFDLAEPRHRMASSLLAWLRLPRRRSARELQLLSNLLSRDCRDPIAEVNAGLPLHPVPAAAQDRNDLTLYVLLALAQHDDIPGSRLRRRRRFRLGHEQCLSCRLQSDRARRRPTPVSGASVVDPLPSLPELASIRTCATSERRTCSPMGAALYCRTSGMRPWPCRAP